MTPSLSALRSLAEAATKAEAITKRPLNRHEIDDLRDFRAACSPDVILALIAEVEEAKRKLQQMIDEGFCITPD